MQRGTLGTTPWSSPNEIERAEIEAPPLTLPSTQGPVNLRVLCAGRAVLYTYPATGVPGRDPKLDPAPGWDDIPGAAGCTVQSLAFQHHYAQFAQAGIRLAGISTQSVSEQRDFASGHGLLFPLLCDASATLQRAWSLPTFVVDDRTFLERMVLYLEANRVRQVIYPISDPQRSAASILQRLGELV